MVSHSEWYRQRYQSAVGGYKRYKAANKKAVQIEYYKTLKEEKKSKKLHNQSSADLVFAEHKIPYEVVQKGVWLVNVNGQKIYFYPTTNRWRVKGKKTIYYSRSALDFLGKVCQHQNQDLIVVD